MTTTRSKVIVAETAEQVRSWAMPEVTGVSANARPHTAAELMAIEKAARAEGFERGRREGLVRGQREGLERAQQIVEQRVRHLDALLAALAAPVAVMDQQVEEELLALTLAVARQLVRREIKTDPGQIVAVLRNAISVLPVADRGVRVFVHPEDATLLREVLAGGDGEHERAWRLVEDPTLSRGGCRVTTENSRLDATVEGRLAQVAAQILGGERSGDASE